MNTITEKYLEYLEEKKWKLQDQYNEVDEELKPDIFIMIRDVYDCISVVNRIETY